MKTRIALCLLIVLCLGAALCACTAPNASTDTSKLDEWDMMSYAQLEGILSLTEVEDERPEVKTWQMIFNNSGTDIYAYVSIPDKVLQDKTPYSCIVYARGGNYSLGSVTANELSSYALTFNSVAVAAEYRGTIYGGGYKTGRDEYGGAGVSDIRKLIDYCEKFAFVDMDRLYMMGVSRGGMMTYRVIREDDRINKAFVLSGIADLFMFYEERPEMHGIQNLIGGAPDLLPQEYEKRSATYWADEIKCPVLIFHSELDAQVSYAQVTKLVAALEAAQKEYRFVSYADNVHGAHKEDRGIIIDWCDFGPKVS